LYLFNNRSSILLAISISLSHIAANDKLTSASDLLRRNRMTFRGLVERWVRPPPGFFLCSAGCSDFFRLLVQSAKRSLNSFYFGFIKIGFTALGTYPSRNSIHSEMVPLPVNMERSNPSFHLSLAVHAVHNLFLSIKSCSHSWELSWGHPFPSCLPLTRRRRVNMKISRPTSPRSQEAARRVGCIVLLEVLYLSIFIYWVHNEILYIDILIRFNLQNYRFV